MQQTITDPRILNVHLMMANSRSFDSYSFLVQGVYTAAQHFSCGWSKVKFVFENDDLQEKMSSPSAEVENLCHFTRFLFS